MNRIYWEEISYFKQEEFSYNPSIYADPQLIYTLDQFRARLGERIFPSPAEGAFVRFTGSKTSQHYVGPKNAPSRKATAIDFFAEGTPIEIFSALLNQFLVKGIGIYLDATGVDGKPWVMFHMDIREKGFKSFPLVWFCKRKDGNNKYYYPQVNAADWKFLQDGRLYVRKEFNKN